MSGQDQSHATSTGASKVPEGIQKAAPEGLERNLPEVSGYANIDGSIVMIILTSILTVCPPHW